MGNKYDTHQQYVEKVIRKYGENIYEFLSEYSGSSSRIKVKHLICGYTWEPVSSTLLSKKTTSTDGTKNHLCPKCSGNARRTNESFKVEVNDLTGGDYLVLGKYINTDTSILMKHNVEFCGYEFKVVPYNFIHKNVRCPRCSTGREVFNINDFKDKVYSLEQNSYLVIGEYINQYTDILMLHCECNREFLISPSNFTHTNRRCPYCFPWFTNKNNYKEKLFNKFGDNYVAIDDYENSSTPMKFQHNIEGCGHIFQRTWNMFYTYESLCPLCNTSPSKGEENILVFLKEKNISYITQYKFNDCRNPKSKYPLPFDVALFNIKGDLLGLIEYDGIQHFEPVDYFGGKEKLEYTQKNDQIKNEYCKNNNIPLLRIPYWEFDNIPNLIEDFLLQIN